MTDRNEEARKAFSLGQQAIKSNNEAIRALAEHVNQHTILLFALMKKLNTNPDELVASLTNENGDLIIPNPAKEPMVII